MQTPHLARCLQAIVPPKSAGVNLRVGRRRLQPVNRWITSRVNANCRSVDFDRDLLSPIMNHCGERRGSPRRRRHQHRRITWTASGVKVTVRLLFLSGGRWMGDNGGAEPVSRGRKALPRLPGLPAGMAGMPGAPVFRTSPRSPRPGGWTSLPLRRQRANGWAAAGAVVAQLCGTDTFPTSAARPMPADTSPGEPMKMGAT